MLCEQYTGVYFKNIDLCIVQVQQQQPSNRTGIEDRNKYKSDADHLEFYDSYNKS